MQPIKPNYFLNLHLKQPASWVSRIFFNNNLCCSQQYLGVRWAWVANSFRINKNTFFYLLWKIKIFLIENNLLNLLINQSQSIILVTKISVLPYISSTTKFLFFFQGLALFNNNEYCFTKSSNFICIFCNHCEIHSLKKNKKNQVKYNLIRKITIVP